MHREIELNADKINRKIKYLNKMCKMDRVDGLQIQVPIMIPFSFSSIVFFFFLVFSFCFLWFVGFQSITN